jgi:hypothetical protein
MINKKQNGRSPGRDPKPGPPEYEAGVVTTRPLHSVRYRINITPKGKLRILFIICNAPNIYVYKLHEREFVNTVMDFRVL